MELKYIMKWNDSLNISRPFESQGTLRNHDGDGNGNVEKQ